MQPTQLNTLPPEQVAILLRKKRFWKKTMWVSLCTAIIILLLGFSGAILGLIRAFGVLQKSGAADPSELAADISTALIAGMVSLPFFFLALTMFLVALIRGLSLPKLPPNC